VSAGPAYYLLSGTSAQPWPAPPSREAACSLLLSFQGLMVPLSTGSVPWFDAALACLSPSDRQIAYAAKHAAGDTHATIIVTYGVNLYPEPDNPYTTYVCPDYASNPAALIALVEEVILAGFIPALFMQEDQQSSTALVQIAAAALKTSSHGDLNAYVLYSPGYDGVFYGWPGGPPSITSWAALARAAGALYLAIEFNPGHIPLGNGPADYAPGGAMTGFDTLLAEFDNWPLVSDVEFQILGRLLGPAYMRPPEQPSGDDPHPPFYLATPSPRGPYYFVSFEYATYPWVRGLLTAAQVSQGRAWYHATGSTLVC
jgi:hypothetical protein